MRRGEKAEAQIRGLYSRDSEHKRQDSPTEVRGQGLRKVKTGRLWRRACGKCATA
jgi:hypothetical protein